MSESWGHTIRLFSGQEQAYLKRMGYTCTGKCPEVPVYETSYSYVTGRAGRVSFARRNACRIHVERFVAKHDLDMPTATTAGAKHALEELLGT